MRGLTGSDRLAPGLLLRGFAPFAAHVARVAGHPLTFMASCIAIMTWGLVSAIFDLPRGWQSTINTVITFVTFLMVFLVQSTQNRDGAAVQAKLDELIRALEPASNRFIGIENSTINEVHELRMETAAEVEKLEELVVEIRQKRDQ